MHKSPAEFPKPHGTTIKVERESPMKGKYNFFHYALLRHTTHFQYSWMQAPPKTRALVRNSQQPKQVNLDQQTWQTFEAKVKLQALFSQ